MHFQATRNCHIAIRAAASCRKQYQREIRSPHYRDVDVVVIADLYGVCNAFSKESWQSTLIQDEGSDCPANQKGLYYEIWALRHPKWVP